MAVFGILILLVIYLLIHSKVSDIEFIEATEELRQKKVSLSTKVETEEAQKQALYEESMKRVEGRESLELRNQIEANEARIAHFDETIDSLTVQLETDAQALSDTLSQRFETHSGVVHTRNEVDRQRNQIEVLKESLTRAEMDAAESEQIIETTKTFLEKLDKQFRVEIDESLAGESVYLIDLGGHRIRAFRIFDGEQSTVESNSSKRLLEKIESDDERKRVFFFVRPDGIETFDQIVTALREKGIPVGYQPVAADEELVLTKFPDRVPADEFIGRGAEQATSTGRNTGIGGNSSPASENRDAAGNTPTVEGAESGASNGLTTAGAEDSSVDDSPKDKSGANHSGAETAAADNADTADSESEGNRVEGEAPESSEEDPPIDSDKRWLLLILLAILAVILLIQFTRRSKQ